MASEVSKRQVRGVGGAADRAALASRGAGRSEAGSSVECQRGGVGCVPRGHVPGGPPVGGWGLVALSPLESSTGVALKLEVGELHSLTTRSSSCILPAECCM